MAGGSESSAQVPLLRGGLAVYDDDKKGTQPRLIVFQYNPEQIRRTLANRTATPPARGGTPPREEVRRVSGPPVETVNLTILLNATDQMILKRQSPPEEKIGLHRVLALLEMLLYPKKS